MRNIVLRDAKDLSQSQLERIWQLNKRCVCVCVSYCITLLVIFSACELRDEIFSPSLSLVSCILARKVFYLLAFWSVLAYIRLMIIIIIIRT